MTEPNILYIHSHDTGRLVQSYGYADVLRHLKARLKAWQEQTEDPILRGPIPPAEG